jgi:hypothetical protein
MFAISGLTETGFFKKPPSGSLFTGPVAGSRYAIQDVKQEMPEHDRLSDLEHLSIDPFNERNELQLGSDSMRFFLKREKKGRRYYAQYDAPWDEVVSFDVCKVHFCKDDLTWPLHEDVPDGISPIDTAGIAFFYTMPEGRAFFPIWSIIPPEEVETVRDMVEARLKRPSLPGLAHHGTAAAVKYMVEHCEVIDRLSSTWYDWTKKGRQAKPNPKFRERGPDYVYCKEGMALDFYGTGEQLEQMSTFWPWRLIKRVFEDDHELTIRYQWRDDAYVFEQQVLEAEERKRFAEAAEQAFDLYHSSDEVGELLLVRPWSFPSRFHRSWDKLEPMSSKASRNAFPPIHDFSENE